MKSKSLSKSFFNQDTIKVARKLLGKIIKHEKTAGIITETEAYKGPEEDEASHAFKKTSRSELMYNSYGKFYVYFIYGNHFCLNITTEKNKPGAVLIRALKPIEGIKIMAKKRKMKINNKNNLTNGPGKLCQAFGITKALNGTNVNNKIKILKGIKIKSSEIFCSSRIGIKKAQHLKWRFFIKK